MRTTKPQEKESLAQVICFDQGMPASVQKLDEKDMDMNGASNSIGMVKKVMRVCHDDKVAQEI